MKQVRPTMGRTLAALFNILGPMSGKRFLDLFSGTGRVAAEARRLGAEIVTVELVRERAAAIRQALGREKHVQVCMDVRRAVAYLERKGMSFDVIFADPPYGAGWMSVLPGILAAHLPLLKPNGAVVIERSGGESLDLAGTPWQLCRERRYGVSVLDFLELKGENNVQV